MKLVKDPNDRKLLHIWRTGTAFEFTERFHLYLEWNNLKFSSLPYPDTPPYLYHVELRKPLPYQDNTFDVVYCNHVFEHLTPEGGRKLAGEIYRVLIKNGIFRVVVPDLESAAREYLLNLDLVLQDPSQANVIRYEWGAADLFDQMVRSKSGGVMFEKLIKGEVDWNQIKRRNGDVFENIRKKTNTRESLNFVSRIRSYIPGSIKDIPEFIIKIWYLIIREIIILISRKPRIELLNERNLWMYDQFSLQKFLDETNFKDVILVNFNESTIEDWSKYNFDQSELGDYPLEPSIYVEGKK